MTVFVAVERINTDRLVVTEHARKRYWGRVLAKQLGDDAARLLDDSAIDQRIREEIGECRRGKAVAELLAPWLTRFEHENNGRPVIPLFHEEKQVVFCVAFDEGFQVVLTCFSAKCYRCGTMHPGLCLVPTEREAAARNAARLAFMGNIRDIASKYVRLFNTKGAENAQVDKALKNLIKLVQEHATREEREFNERRLGLIERAR